MTLFASISMGLLKLRSHKDGGSNMPVVNLKSTTINDFDRRISSACDVDDDREKAKSHSNLGISMSGVELGVIPTMKNVIKKMKTKSSKRDGRTSCSSSSLNDEIAMTLLTSDKSDNNEYGRIGAGST